jgi:hypothetical protein
MKIRLALAIILATLLAAAPVRATDEHEYARDEYAIIRDGMAPDQSVSLAAHAGAGGEGFHVWLMAEPAHRRIVALAAIVARLDTGPDSYRTTWSADSRHAAVSFRSDRHTWELNLYGIDKRSAHLLSGPSLFSDVTGRDLASRDDIRSSFSSVEWRGGRRFLLREHLLLRSSDPDFARGLGRFGKQSVPSMDGGSFFEFSAEADCLLLPGHRYRIVDLRVGKFDEPEKEAK